MFGFISQLLVGGYSVFKKTKQREAWFRFIASITGTAFVTFWGTLGAVGGSMLANGIDPVFCAAAGFFAASLAMASSVLALWKKSPMTNGIPILAPMKVEQEVLEGSFTYTEKGEKQ